MNEKMCVCVLLVCTTKNNNDDIDMPNLSKTYYYAPFFALNCHEIKNTQLHQLE